MSQLPDLPRDGGPPAERRLSTHEMEVVIRRAVELQAGATDGAADEGVSTGELVRIGREIGIAPQYIQRALAETMAGAQRPAGFGDRLFGFADVRASRTVPGDAGQVSDLLDRYLTQREWLAPVRRFPGRTMYEKARGVDLARAVSATVTVLGGVREPQVGAGFKLSTARRVEVAVQQLEPGFSHVSLAADVANSRSVAAVGTLVGGGGGSVAVAATLGVAVAPAAAVLGLPVLGAVWWGMRAIHGHTVERAQLHLESLLDVLERGEPLVLERKARR